MEELKLTKSQEMMFKKSARTGVFITLFGGVFCIIGVVLIFIKQYVNAFETYSVLAFGLSFAVFGLGLITDKHRQIRKWRKVSTHNDAIKDINNEYLELAWIGDIVGTLLVIGAFLYIRQIAIQMIGDGTREIDFSFDQILYLILGLICAITIIIACAANTVRDLNGVKIRPLTDYIAIHPDEKYEIVSQLNDAYYGQRGVNDLYAMPDYLLHKWVKKMTFIKAERILWIYMDSVVGKDESGKNTDEKAYIMHLALNNKSIIKLPMLSKEAAEECMEYLMKQYPWIVFGKYPQLVKDFNENIEAMIEKVNNRRLGS